IVCRPRAAYCTRRRSYKAGPSMTELQVFVTLAVLVGLVVVLLFDWVDITVAGLLSVSALLIFGILSQKDFLNVVSSGGGVLALLFGGMVVARTLTPTGIFEK